MKKVFLNEFTSEEVGDLLANKKIDSAITIFGSCESHGAHLPLGPDIFVPTEIARLAALKLDKTIVVPGIPFGTSTHYNSTPMAISIRFETVIAVAQDIFESLIHYGIKHIFVFNGHDGNIPALEIAQRNIKDKHRDVVFAYLPAWWAVIGDRLGKGFFAEWNGLGHGGEGESSLTAAVRPELCDLSKAVRQMPDDIVRVNPNVQILWDISEVSETGATGDPTYASIEKGERMRDALVDLVVESIQALEKTNWKYGLLLK